MNLHHLNIAYHRNGVAGNGFYICIFDWRDGGKVRRMTAVVFPEPGNIAVLDLDETGKGNIDFGMGNSWRGDDFEPDLRRAIDRIQATYGELVVAREPE